MFVKATRRKEVINMRRKISEIENRKTLKNNNNKTKSWFFEKIKKQIGRASCRERV